jgi:DNA-binding NarL/FixJ family response regulator
MNIVVADNESKVRFALRTLLVQRAQMKVVGEAESADELLTVVEAARPDLVVLDWRLQGMAVNDLLPSLKAACPDLHVIVLSARREARPEALAAGADAFVNKMDQPEKLLAELRSVRSAYADKPTHPDGAMVEERPSSGPASTAARRAEAGAGE